MTELIDSIRDFDGDITVYYYLVDMEIILI